MSSHKLFQATRVGEIDLAHRVVFAPTTRFRADGNHAPLPHVAEYYAQRASTPGSLLITEATLIAARAGGHDHVPGIWSDEQIAAWKKVTEAVHARGSFIYLQLWAMGRAAEAPVLAAEGLPFVSASDIPISGTTDVPRPLTIEEIKEYVQLWATGASNAVHKAGFDGVEVHGANGYLLDQFLHDRSNIRTDAYGGSVENRARFPLEVVEAVVKAVGETKTGFRISPWGTYNDMRFDHLKPTYTHLVTELRDRYPHLAYLHVVEADVGDWDTVEAREGTSNDFIRDIWGDRRLISAGGYTRETALATAQHKGDLIAFARRYIANPDLPHRLLHDIALTVGNRALYYSPGSVDPAGFTDYPFATPTIEAR
ncbi:NADH:flavin oxidoreductase/NADH oxidase [Roridomyces roridus]|uniref:NADH:flavin oxidoreductase/NADH oxidase n=1 Tax=Roridomyces roridus TaxID=1738132 RepID=A0AAD7BGY0_9AGAR|nr:NADH:flavin oxidoreductase/NADH oxidase [Roridomyces roridus]